MIVLGIIDSKPSAAAIAIDGKLVAAVSEERLCRLKMADGMPLAAIGTVIELAKLSPEQIDVVVVAQKVKMFIPEPVPWSGWFEEEEKSSGKRRFDNLGGLIGSCGWTLARYLESTPRT